jgi:hypothetical protein
MDGLVVDTIIYISNFLSFDGFKSFRACSTNITSILDREYETRIKKEDEIPEEYFLRNGLTRYIENKGNFTTVLNETSLLPVSPDCIIISLKRGHIDTVRKYWGLVSTTEISSIMAYYIVTSIASVNENNNSDYYDLFSHASDHLVPQKDPVFWECIKLNIRFTDNVVFVQHVHQIYLHRKTWGCISPFRGAVKLNRIKVAKYFVRTSWDQIDNLSRTPKLLKTAMKSSFELFKLMYEKSKIIDLYSDDSYDLARIALLSKNHDVLFYLVEDRKLGHITDRLLEEFREHTHVLLKLKNSEIKG